MNDPVPGALFSLRESLAPQIPARVSSERRGEVRVPDAPGHVAVGVDGPHENGIGISLRGRHESVIVQVQRIVGRRIPHARDVRKLGDTSLGEPVVGDGGEAARGRLDSLLDPFVQGDAQG